MNLREQHQNNNQKDEPKFGSPSVGPLYRLTEASYSNGDYYHYTGVYPELVEGIPPIG